MQCFLVLRPGAKCREWVDSNFFLNPSSYCILHIANWRNEKNNPPLKNRNTKLELKGVVHKQSTVTISMVIMLNVLKRKRWTTTHLILHVEKKNMGVAMRRWERRKGTGSKDCNPRSGNMVHEDLLPLSFHSTQTCAVARELWLQQHLPLLHTW